MSAHRDFFTVGAAYLRTEEQRAHAEAAADHLTWVDPTGPHPALPALGLQGVIDELGLPEVTAVAYGGDLPYPDGAGTAHYSLLGVEANYVGARCRLILIDTGTAAIPLWADVEPATAAAGQ